MAIDIELLLARHPLLFFRWECRVKGFDSGGVLTAIGGGGGNIHPLFAVECIRQKLGKLLIEYSFEVARKMGYDVNINFGNPGNYVSRGFVSCKKKNVSFVVDGNFPTALLVAELVLGALDGRKWMYIPSTAADCCEDTAAVEAFDATFSPKEKKWMPSQEEFYIYSHSSVVR